MTWGVDAFDATPVLAPAAPKATFTFGKLVEMVEQRRASTHRLPAAGTWEDDEDGPEPSYLDPSSIAGLFEGSAAAPKDRRKVIADAIAYVNRRS